MVWWLLIIKYFVSKLVDWTNTMQENFSETINNIHKNGKFKKIVAVTRNVIMGPK